MHLLASSNILSLWWSILIWLVIGSQSNTYICPIMIGRVEYVLKPPAIAIVFAAFEAAAIIEGSSIDIGI